MKHKIKKIIVNELKKYIKREFPNDARGWKQATDELPAIGLFLYEEYKDFRGSVKEVEDEIRQTSRTPAEHNTKWSRIVNKFIKRVNDDSLMRLYRTYGHWFIDQNKQKVIWESADLEFQQLNESAPVVTQKVEKIDEDLVYFMLNPTNQFKFDCGLIFENLVKPKAAHTKHSIMYHINNSANLDECFQSINDALAVAGGEMTNDDKERLEIHINKHLNS